MRPTTPTIDSRAELADYIDAYPDRLDGRLGVFLGIPKSGTATGFDVVYTHRAEERFESASIIKLPVLYTLYHRYDGHLGELTEPHGLATINRVAGSGLFHLLGTTTPSLEDLAYAMIAISDNAATNELIDVLGRETINTVATSLGMDHTRLGRKLMATLGDNQLAVPVDLPDDEPANVIAPIDCARFYRDLIAERTLSTAAYERLKLPLREQKYGDTFPRYLPYDMTILHKTGWVPSAALDTGYIAADDAAGDPLVFAVFTDDLDHGADGSDVIAEIGDAVAAWLA
ncbi:MAG: serine hydrolase [Halobacteriales archaeon]